MGNVRSSVPLMLSSTRIHVYIVMYLEINTLLTSKTATEETYTLNSHPSVICILKESFDTHTHTLLTL